MKYFIGFLISIGLIVGVFLLVLNGFKSTTKTTKTTVKPLVSYADSNREVRFTTEGAINSADLHRSVQISVNKDYAEIVVFKGYNQEVLKSQRYNATSAGYAEFLRAIDLLGFTKGLNKPELKDDRGFCATGQRFIFEIFDGNDSKQYLWTTSCGKGNFAGTASTIKTLFQNQIPAYNTYIRGVVL